MVKIIGKVDLNPILLIKEMGSFSKKKKKQRDGVMILSYKVFGKDRNLLNHKLNTKEIQTDLAKANSEQCQAS